MWDGLKVDETSQSLLKYFDETYCYVREDSESYNTKYASNFYLDAFNYSQEKKDIGFFYVGILRERERAETLRIIDNYTQGDKKTLKLYGRQRDLDKLTSSQQESLKKYLSKESVSIDELALFYKRSRVLIDIPIAGQRGLGLRPIEAIGAKCKLLTTNTSVREYDFYNKNNIFILEKDYSNINLLSTWLKLPFHEYSDELNYKYSFDGFLDKILMKP